MANRYVLRSFPSWVTLGPCMQSDYHRSFENWTSNLRKSLLRLRKATPCCFSSLYTVCDDTFSPKIILSFLAFFISAGIVNPGLSLRNLIRAFRVSSLIERGLPLSSLSDGKRASIFAPPSWYLFSQLRIVARLIKLLLRIRNFPLLFCKHFQDSLFRSPGSIGSINRRKDDSKTKHSNLFFLFSIHRMSSCNCGLCR